MLRAICCLAVVSAAAMETPLVVFSENQAQTFVTVSPAQGTVTLYTAEDQQLVRKGAANFHADLERRAQWVIEERNGAPWSFLRTGSYARTGQCGNQPTPVEVMTGIAKGYPYPKEEREAGEKPPLERMLALQDAFWKELPAYDGVVRAALSREYLMLAIPARQTLMFYRLEGTEFKLVGWRNYGPDLLIPQALRSDPLPQQMLQQMVMPPDKRTEVEKTLAGSGRLPAAMPKSDLWVAAMPNDSFIAVDVLNQRVMAYQITGKNIELRSARNLAIDLQLPDLLGESLGTTPRERDLIGAAARDRNREAIAKQFGIVIDRDHVVTLAGQSRLPTAGVKLQAAVSSERVVIDFAEQRKLVELDFRGQTQLRLISVRSYVVDAGIAVLEEMFQNVIDGHQIYEYAKSQATRKITGAAMANLKLALQLNPFLVKDAQARAELIELKKHPDWQSTIDTALKAVEELRKKAEERERMIQDKKKERAGAAGGAGGTGVPLPIPGPR
jgi:hypothetical protein